MDSPPQESQEAVSVLEVSDTAQAGAVAGSGGDVAGSPAKGSFVLDHISYSSVLCYLNNPSAWYRRYVLGLRDQKTSPAALVGTAFHKWAEMGYKGHGTLALAEAQRVIREAEGVEWGATGSVEKALTELDSLLAHFRKERPRIGNVLAVEHGDTVKVKGLKLPLKSYIDLVHERDGEIVLTDWKTVRSLEDKPKPAHLVQACCYYWTACESFGRKPKCFEITQIKASVNKSGGPQVVTLVVEYEKEQKLLKSMKTLINSAITEMRRKRKFFLPNLRDDLDGEDGFNHFLSLT